MAVRVDTASFSGRFFETGNGPAAPPTYVSSVKKVPATDLANGALGELVSGYEEVEASDAHALVAKLPQTTGRAATASTYNRFGKPRY